MSTFHIDTFKTTRLPIAFALNFSFLANSLPTYIYTHFLSFSFTLSLSASSPPLLTLPYLVHFWVHVSPPSFLHAVGARGGDMSHKQKKGRKKMGHITWRYSADKKVALPSNVALEAPTFDVRRTHRENSDLVRQWHVYGWWAQASDFHSRDCNLAPGPSHLEHLGLKPFQETRHESCWVEPEHSSFMLLCLLLLSLRLWLSLYLIYILSHAGMMSIRLSVCQKDLNNY